MILSLGSDLHKLGRCPRGESPVAYMSPVCGELVLGGSR